MPRDSAAAHEKENRCAATFSCPRRLYSTDQMLQLIRRASNIPGQLMNDVDDPLGLADLHEFVDKVLVGLQCAQEIR